MTEPNNPLKNRRDFLKDMAAGLAAFTAVGIGGARADEVRLTDAQLLDKVQQQTLRYFWEHGQAASGMARETSDDNSVYGKNIVTTGGTGFGVMAMVAGASRGWIGREEVQKRIAKIVGFLKGAEHYHGVFAHWLDGNSGKTFAYPGSKDDGADLVETSFLMMGLLTARQYFSGQTPEEKALRDDINQLWERVNWQRHTKDGKSKELYWHWSPNHEWGMNVPIKGWNESLVTHVLAASSPTHPVSPDVYHEGWATGNDFTTAQTCEGIKLPLGPRMGGPLFLSQYSFMGLDPNGLKDKYADYLEQNKNHTLINRAYCIRNPKGHTGYGPKCWGLTSSKGDISYSDHSPTNDRGIIAPTAALSSFPYTPEYSMEVLRHLYEERPRDKIWGESGFYDAFRSDGSWYSKEYLAIDQGPIVGMIENHRSGLLWSLFMSCPEVQAGMKKLGFESPRLVNAAGKKEESGAIENHADRLRKNRVPKETPPQL
jgi:hypothetical protein